MSFKAVIRDRVYLDHDLLLQLERANEALSDRVDFLENHEDKDTDIATLTERIDDINERIATANDRMLEMANLITELTERQIATERALNEVLHALERTLLQ